MSPRKKSKREKKIAVLYHAGCSDGFGGAYAAWTAFGNRADYYPMQYGDKAPVLRGKTVYLIDFMFDSDAPLRVLQKANKQVTAIDHHVSNKARVMSTTDYRYARYNSGAVLAWQYFRPGKPVPLLLKYIEDRDIWAFKLNGTEEFNAFLLLQPQNFKTWNALVKKFENTDFRKEVMRQGKILREYELQLARAVIEKSAMPVKFMGHAVYAINFNGPKTVADEIQDVLAKKHPPFSILWKLQNDSMIHVSLRGNGTIDVTKLAERFGGGGHHDSSGFGIKADMKLPWKPIK